jgi:hypothetical protein
MLPPAIAMRKTQLAVARPPRAACGLRICRRSRTAASLLFMIHLDTENASQQLIDFHCDKERPCRCDGDLATGCGQGWF